jgi:nitrite reductase (NADH) large subunit
VIIGNGMASYKLCERLVESGAAAEYDILVFGEDPHPAYDRVHLTDSLDGRQLDRLALASRDWYREHGIRLHTNHRVVSVDREAREVSTDGSMRCRYDKLVFATGSYPFVPPIDGVRLPGVFVYRTIDDLAAIRRHSLNAGSAAVVGGGLLGLEAARALDRLGVRCHVVEYAPHLLVAQLDQNAGRLAADQLEALGIRVHANVRLDRLRQLGTSGLALELTGGAEPELHVDMVVVAAGIRPRIELADSCGLDTGKIGGIVVNDRLETSDPDIYAIGECAAHRGVIYGLVAPAYRMAETLAASLMGRPTRFLGADTSTRLKVLGMEVAVIGDYKQPGRIVTWSDRGAYRRLVLDRDRLIGASALGHWPEVGLVQDAVRDSRRVWMWQLARFRRQGRLFRDRVQPVDGWAANATVCNCMNLSCGALRAAIGDGCSTPEALANRTGASTLCGSCRPLLEELTGSDRTPVVAAGSPVLVASGVAVLFAAVGIALAAPIPYPDTALPRIPYDWIWRSGAWRQTTGFILVGVTLTGLSMSLRKRWRRFRWGEFGVWRAFHAALGVAGLAVLAAHTGLRFGDNFNSVLMTTFVGANVVGALLGGVAGLESGMPALRATGARRWLTWMHIALAWPLPALVAAHVLTAYLF